MSQPRPLSGYQAGIVRAPVSPTPTDAAAPVPTPQPSPMPASVTPYPLLPRRRFTAATGQPAAANGPRAWRQLWIGAIWPIVFASLGGCAQWSQLPLRTADSTENRGNVAFDATMQRDTIVLELAFVRLSTLQEKQLVEVWSKMDEQCLPIEVRRRLEANGVRAGVANAGLPTRVLDWVAESERRLAEDPLEQAGVASDVDLHFRRLTLRPHQPKEVIVKTRREEPLIVLHQTERLRGRTYENPELQLELSGSMSVTGRVDLRLTPIISHGEASKRVVSQRSAMRFEYQHAREVFQDLVMPLALSTDQLMMITASPVPKGLGEALFTTIGPDQQPQRVVMLVRVVSTPGDPLGL